MKNLFDMGDYGFIKNISKIEKTISEINSRMSTTHLEGLYNAANIFNQGIAKNPPIISYPENIARILESLHTYQNSWNQDIINMTSGIAEFQNRIHDQISIPTEGIQAALSLFRPPLTDFSAIFESIRSEHLLEQCVEEIDSNEENSEISSEEITEAYNDLTDLSKDSRNWQQKLADFLQKWKEKNPVLCFLLMSVVLAIINNILSTPFTSAITSNNNARIKDEPSASGNIIFNLSVNQEVTIISNTTNYYYEIEFYDEETGEWKKGWISKRSVKINKETSESEPDDTEEESE